jgi:molecular chaperone GrpE (heat shock protein)
MPQTELGKLLDDLDNQIGDGGPVDEADREALRELQARIASALATDRDAILPVSDNLSEPLADFIDRFETSHPTLTMTLGRIMDALNKMGI